MNCPGCEATVTVQQANKETVKREAKNYANSHHADVVLYMEMGEWLFIQVSQAIGLGIPFDPANVVRFDTGSSAA